jgi:hypothetical protein
MRVQTAVTARLAAMLLQLQAGEAALGIGAGHPAACVDKLTCAEGARLVGTGFLLPFESVTLDARGVFSSLASGSDADQRHDSRRDREDRRRHGLGGV